MSRHRVTISGKVEDDGTPRNKMRQIARRDLEAGNVRDAVIQAMDQSGLDGFSSGEFSIKVSDPND